MVKKVKIPIKVLVGIGIIAIIIGYFLFEPFEVTLSFRIDQNNQPIDGHIYLNDLPLGYTEKGSLKIPKEKLTSGDLLFQTKYKGREFEFNFKINESDLGKDFFEFYVPLDKLNSYTFNFYIKETGMRLNGTVYLNNNYLGEVLNGKIILSIDVLSPGIVSLKGKYKDRNFKFSFEFLEEDLRNRYKDFIISQKEWKEAVFDTSEMNINILEDQILSLVNKYRQANTSLKADFRLTQIARSYSEKMAKEGFFAHTDPQGNDIFDRLQANKIFYITAGENLYLIEGIRAETNISEEVVNGWMESPGHRSPIVDLDGLYSHAGVGLYCENRSCYVTMIFVKLEKKIIGSLPPDYCVCYHIYDPAYPFNYDVDVSITLNATEKLNAYIVEGCSIEMDNCVKRNPIRSINEYIYANQIREKLTARKGYGLLLTSYQYTSYIVEFNYRS